MEPAFHEGRRRTAAQQVEGLSMFDEPSEPRVPAIEPPSQPIASSERAAATLVRTGAAVTQSERIIRALHDADCVYGNRKYLSRDDIIRATELSVNAACGRLGPSSALVIEHKLYVPGSCQMAVVAVEDSARSSTGNKVMGYALTPHGVRLAEAIRRRT